MKAIFIAAGSGSRLGDITKNVPKPMVLVNGKSILERQISILKKNNINNIVVISGPHKEKFNLKNLTYLPDIDYLHHDQLGSLMTAREELNGDVLILYADILFDEKILQQITNTNCDFGIAIDMNWEKSYEHRFDNPKSEADKVCMENGIIKRLSKNIIHEKDQFKIGEFLGIIKLSNVGCETLKNVFETLNQKNNLGKFHDARSFQRAKIIDILQEINMRKKMITPILIEGNWCEIDTPNDLILAEKSFS